jgi:alkaline phosphatase D
MTKITRRFALFAAGALAAAPIPAWARDLPQGQFTHGVASGDPLASAVVIWTRFVPANGAYGEIGYEVATDEAFASVVARGKVLARATNDYCCKIDVQGLRPGSRFFYRFLSGSGASPVGQTLTTPVGRTRALKLALFSCSNYGFGYFHAYAHAAADPTIDVVVHVGDYIYEYASGSYPSAAQTAPGRAIETSPELVALDGYYSRYQTYRADPSLQELHRVKPWILVWDDHELANDAWSDGAQNHSPDTEGPWASRFAHAWKAYLDWMPVRTGAITAGGIYRSFMWGDLAGLAMLDTRWFGREHQLDYADFLGPVADQGPAAQMAALATLQTQLRNPDRTLLGAEQEAWLNTQFTRFADANVTWTVLGQQIVFAPLIAAPQMPSFLPDDAPSYVRQYATTGAMLGAAGLEWNLDAWSGYPAARERLVQAALRQGGNTIILSGDSHNAWISDIAGGPSGRPALLEVAGTGVTSPGLEAYTTRAGPGQREAAMQSANPGLKQCDLTNKGYATLTLTRQTALTELISFSSWRTPQAPTAGVVRVTAEAVRGPGVGGWQTT